MSKAMQGQQLGKYVIDRLIGSGGMASVYLATHQTLGSKVAIKILKTELAANPEIVERFLKEARTAAKLKHPHIVRVHDVEQDGTLIYCVMDYIDGRSLKDFLAEEKALPENLVLDLSRQVLSALSEAHAQGVIHRDIKPDNIIIDHRGQAHITDFGIAKATAEADLTLTGVFIGTPRYASPEQIQGQAIDLRSDLYSWSVVMYEMVTGQLAFKNASLTTIIYKVINEVLPPPAAILASVNSELSDTIFKGMAKKAEDRFHSAQEMKQALERVAAFDFSNHERSTPHLRQNTQDAESTLALEPQAHPPNANNTPAAKGRKSLTVVVTLSVFFGLVVAFWQGGFLLQRDQHLEPTRQAPEKAEKILEPISSPQAQRAEKPVAASLPTATPKPSPAPVTKADPDVNPAPPPKKTAKPAVAKPIEPVKPLPPPPKSSTPKIPSAPTPEPAERVKTAATPSPKQQTPVAAAPKNQSQPVAKIKTPALSARFNREPACFRPGSEARVLVNSEAGAYIYLLNLAADQSVSLLYPNEQLPEKKQSSDRFEFPPAALGAVMKLQFYPLVEGMMSRESIRVISSFSRVDLTPVLQPPATGSAAGQWQRAEEELARMKKHEGWNEQVLDYQVGPDCPN